MDDKIEAEQQIETGNEKVNTGGRQIKIERDLIELEDKPETPENLQAVQIAFQQAKQNDASFEKIGDQFKIILEDQNVDKQKERILTAEGILGHIESTDPAEIVAANEALFNENMQLQCAKSFCESWVGAGGPRAEQMQPQNLVNSDWFSKFSAILPYF